MAGQPPSPLQAQRPHQSLALLQPPHSHRSLEAGQPQQKAVVREEAKMQPLNSSQGGLWAKEFREKLRAIHESLSPECTWQTFQAGWQEACVNMVQLKLHREAWHPGKVH